MGVVIQRFGECRAQNLFEPVAVVSQQISKLEEATGGDAVFVSEDKLLIIEFRAPVRAEGDRIHYPHVDVAKIQRAIKRVSKFADPNASFHLLGLPHSYGVSSKVTAQTGVWGIRYVPFTTTFFDSRMLKCLSPDEAIIDDLSVLALDASGLPPDANFKGMYPSCATYDGEGFANPLGCLTCGFLGSRGVRHFLVEADGLRGVCFHGVSLATLLFDLTRCAYGTKIVDIDLANRQWSELLAEFQSEGGARLALVQNPRTGPRVLASLGESGTIELSS